MDKLKDLLVKLDSETKILLYDNDKNVFLKDDTFNIVCTANSLLRQRTNLNKTIQHINIENNFILVELNKSKRFIDKCLKIIISK